MALSAWSGRNLPSMRSGRSSSTCGVRQPARPPEGLRVPDLLEADHLDEVVEAIERRLHGSVVDMVVINAGESLGRSEQAGRRVDRRAEAHLLQLYLWENGRLAAMQLVGHQRGPDRTADLLHFRDRFWRFDEDRIGAGLDVGVRA